MAQSDNAKKVLDGLVGDVRRAFLEDHTILSFMEYFNLVVDNPQRHLRSSAQYVVDVFDHFGRDELQLATGRVTRFRLFDAPFADGEGRVAGQEQVQEQLYRILANFAREGRVNKLILMHGPNGSAKSSLVRCIMAGMEAYARLPEGALYTFNWIFPSERLASSDRIGFGSERRAASAGESYAYLPAESVDARVPCDMHDHPLFLIPQAQRTELLKQLMPDPGSLPKTGDLVAGPHAVSDYLRLGDLCYKCRRIYDALLASYDGDVSKVLNHIQIERFYVSRRYRRGAATIEPQLSVDARIQQVTADRSLTSLPKALQHTSLYEPTGPLVDANRGLLEYSDLLKRPVDTFKYLLGTIETATVSMDSFVLHLDMVYMASTNEVYLDAFKEHPDFPSFKGRMDLIKVPYLLRYGAERGIYTPQITGRVVGRHIAPHAIDVAALWAVLTRMRRSDPALYPKEIAEVMESITPLEKLRLYDAGELPGRLTTREAKELRHRIADIYRESYTYPNYEGRFGASAREIRSALLNAAHAEGFKCLSPLAVFAEIKELLQGKTVYEFLRQEIVHGYHDHAGFLRQTEELYTHWVDNEIREATGIAAAESYADLFSRYIAHVSHWVKREKMQDPVSGDLRDPDEGFMGEIEKVLMSPGERSQDFRRAVIGSIGARALEMPNDKPDYAEIFKSYIDRLREDFFAKRKKVLGRIMETFLKYSSEDRKSLDPKELEQSEAMLAALKARNDYCEHCARDAVAYLVRKRYAES
jgi:serine protein kinase